MTRSPEELKEIEKIKNQLREQEKQCREEFETTGRRLSLGIADSIADMLMNEEEKKEKYAKDLVERVNEMIEQDEHLRANKQVSYRLSDIDWGKDETENYEKKLKVYDRISNLDDVRSNYLDELIYRYGEYDWESHIDEQYMESIAFARALAVAELKLRNFGELKIDILNAIKRPSM